MAATHFNPSGLVEWTTRLQLRPVDEKMKVQKFSWRGTKWCCFITVKNPLSTFQINFGYVGDFDKEMRFRQPEKLTVCILIYETSRSSPLGYREYYVSYPCMEESETPWHAVVTDVFESPQLAIAFNAGRDLFAEVSFEPTVKFSSVEERQIRVKTKLGLLAYDSRGAAVPISAKNGLGCDAPVKYVHVKGVVAPTVKTSDSNDPNDDSHRTNSVLHAAMESPQKPIVLLKLSPFVSPVPTTPTPSLGTNKNKVPAITPQTPSETASSFNHSFSSNLTFDAASSHKSRNHVCDNEENKKVEKEEGEEEDEDNDDNQTSFSEFTETMDNDSADHTTLDSVMNDLSLSPEKSKISQVSDTASVAKRKRRKKKKRPKSHGGTGAGMETNTEVVTADRQSITSQTSQQTLGQTATTTMVIPEAFFCPIGLDVMVDPVMCVDGHSYERRLIEDWLTTHHTSPITNEPLPSLALFPNHALRKAINEFF